MKRLFLFISLLISLTTSAQLQPRPVQTVGNKGNVVLIPGVLAVDSAAQYRYSWPDTTSINAGLFIKYQAGAIVRTGDTLWQRSNDLSKWIKIGAGSVSVQNSPSVSWSGVGTTNDPLQANVVASGQTGNAVQIFSDGVYVATPIVNGLNSGGEISLVLDAGYTYDVTAATFAIGGVSYSTPYTQVTLANSDPTFDRFDAVVAQTDGTVAVITGAPAEDPQQPSHDPTTQIVLGYILVTANSTEPDDPQEWIYLSNVEWTTASSTARINPASTNNPYSPPLDVEGTNVQNNDNIRYTDTGTLTISDYNILTFKIRSKAVWVNTSRIILQWYNSSIVATGSAVSLANNMYGFQSSSTSGYQTITIPLTAFGSLTNPTNLLMTASTVGGATIGFYIDDVQLQGSSDVPSGGNFWNNGGNTGTLVGGTLDANDVSLITNNTQKMRILSGGTVLVNKATATTLDSGIPVFQITGKSLIQKGIFGTTLTEEGLGANALDIYGNTYIGGTTPTITWNNRTLTLNAESTNGRLLLTSSATGNAYEVQHNRVDGTMLKALNTVTSATSQPGFTWRYKNTATLTSTAWSETQGEVGNYLSLNLTNSASSWIRTLTPFLQYAEFYPLNTSSGVIKRVGVSTDPTSSIDNIETVYRTYRTFYPTGIGAGEVVIGATTTDNTHILQVTGGLSVDATSSNIKFTGLSTDNDAPQVLAKEDLNGTMVWLDVSAIAGVATTTLQEAITNGATLTGNNTILGGGFNFTISNSHVSFGGPGNNSFSLEDGGGDMTFSGQAGDIRLSTAGTGNNIVVSVGSDLFDINGTTTADDIFIQAGERIRMGSNASDLSSPSNGDVYYNTSTNKFRAYENGSWTDMIPVGGSPMTNPMTTTGDIIYSSDNSGTPARLGIDTDGDVLTLVGGLPTWVTPGVGGSVTSVAAAGTGIFSWTGSPVTTSGTLTLVATGTSGGIPYFSGATTLSSSAVLAANAIVIGGGAGVAPSTTTTGTAVLTALGVNVGSAGAFVVNGGALGTPSSGTLTNATGLPIATGVSGLGTGVATALAVNTGSSGAVVLFNGALGTPSSGTISTGVTIGDVTMNVTGTDAEGDMYYRNSSGVLVRMGVGTNGQIITSNGTIPQWSPASAAGTASVQGTLNQVLVNGTTGSPQTGAITLTLPQSIHTTATPTFYGLNLGPSGTPSSFSLVLQSTSTSASIHNVGQVNAVAGQLGIIHNQQGTIAEASSGNHPVLAGLYIIPPTIISGSATVTETASIYVEGAPSATVTGANYAVNINTGNIRVGGLAGAGRYITSDANGVLTLGFNRTVQTLTDGATIVWNVTNGGNAVVTLGGTGRTLSLSNAVAGETYIIRIIQGSGGSKTITTWPSGTRWSGGSAPTLSTTAGDIDIITFYYDGANFYGIANTDFS